MINRVTSTSLSSNIVLNMQKSYADYAKLTEQISSGKKVSSILDDPIQSINIINSNRELNKISTWESNIDYLTNELKQSTDTIEFAIEKSQRIKDLATLSANKTYNMLDLKSVLSEVDVIIESMVDMANTNYNGNYIYSGANIKVPPYEIQYDTSGEIVGMKYNGTDKSGAWERKLEVSDGIFEKSNVTGIEVFGESDITGNSSGIMGDLIDFRNILKEKIKKLEEQENLPNNSTQADKDKIASEINSCYTSMNNLLTDIDDSITNMISVNSHLGSVSNKLEMSKESLIGTKLNITTKKSEMENIDLTEAISEWYLSQYSYQASMQVFQSSNSLSLLNYI